MQISTKRLLMALAMVPIALGIASCGSSSESAKVVGTVKLCGGPRPGCFRESVDVSVRSQASRKLVTQTHEPHGRFSFNLSPGVYAVVASHDGKVIGNTSVRVSTQRVVHVTIVDGNVY